MGKESKPTDWRPWAAEQEPASEARLQPPNKAGAASGEIFTVDLASLQWLAANHAAGDGREHAATVIGCMQRHPAAIDVQRLGLQILTAFLRRSGADPQAFTIRDTLDSWCQVAVAALNAFRSREEIVQVRSASPARCLYSALLVLRPVCCTDVAAPLPTAGGLQLPAAALQPPRQQAHCPESRRPIGEQTSFPVGHACLNPQAQGQPANLRCALLAACRIGVADPARLCVQFCPACASSHGHNATCKAALRPSGLHSRRRRCGWCRTGATMRHSRRSHMRLCRLLQGLCSSCSC